ncbi:MAG: hypothetical protein RL687_163 [Candidatus Parcubacteria bacterium]|jgi:hypothetical protein
MEKIIYLTKNFWVFRGFLIYNLIWIVLAIKTISIGDTDDFVFLAIEILVSIGIIPLFMWLPVFLTKIPNLSNDHIYPMELHKLKEKCIRHIEGISNQKSSIHHGEETFQITDLIDQVDKGTELGMKYLNGYYKTILMLEEN